MTAATLPARPAPPDTFPGVSVAAIEEPPPVTEPVRELPPLPVTGDAEADEALALMRETTTAIHDAQDLVAELSERRKRIVLDLRRRGVKFRQIADAAGSTDQTILKIHRDAKRDEQERADRAEAERLGYPSVEEYRYALADAPDPAAVPAYAPEVDPAAEDPAPES